MFISLGIFFKPKSKIEIASSYFFKVDSLRAKIIQTNNYLYLYSLRN